jgi:excisionase family DNA binding protein
MMAAEIMNAKQVSEYLHVNEKKVYSLVAKDGLPATKVTGKWLFPKDLVDQWLKGSMSMPRGSPAAEHGILMVAGSDDPLLAEVLGRLNQSFGDTVSYFGSTGSTGGLLAVARGQGHLAGSHLWDAETDTYNRRQVAELLPGQKPLLVNFAYREQGFVVVEGNPKGFRGWDDLVRPDLSFVNRQKGSGTRQLLDYHLGRLGISGDKIRGYDRELESHFSVALSILRGEANVGMAIRCAAMVFSLGFIPVKEERYDLVVPHGLVSAKSLQRLLDIVGSEESRQAAERLGGYSMRDAGRIVCS